MAIQAVVLSGGSGSRMWPTLRESYPRQLVVHEASREGNALKGLPDALNDAIVVTKNEYRLVVTEQL